MTDISEKLAHMKHMPALITATLATGSPTQSFIITDIVNMSFESHDARGFLLKYLLNQLVASKNVYVKLKVLQVLTAVVERGHIEFKISLSKQTEGIAEASKLVAKETALASDCSKIRDLANRLLELLFDDSGDNVRRQPTISQFQRQGDSSRFGGGGGASSSYGGGGGASSSYGGGGASSSYGGGGSATYGRTDGSSGSKYIGFGNTPPPAPSEDIGTKLSKAIQKTGLILPGQLDNKPLPYDASYVSMTPVATNYSGPKFAPTYPVSNTGRPAESLLGREHVSGYAGGGWDGPSTQLGVPARREDTFKSDSQRSPGTQSKSDAGEQERLLVEEITTPSGVRAAPPRDVLNNFITRCKSLDTLAIVECLRDCLSSDQDQVVLRSLFVVEALIRSDVPDVVSYLDLTLEALNALTSSSNASIRSKATKLMAQLTAQGSQEEQKSQVPAVSDDTAESTPDASGLFEGLSLTSGTKKRVTPTKPSPPTSRAARSSVAPVVKPNDDLNSLLFDTPSAPPPALAPLPDVKPVEPTAGESLLQFEDDNFDPIKTNASSVPLAASSSSKGSTDVLSQLSGIGSVPPVQQSTQHTFLQPQQPAAYPAGGSLLTPTPGAMATGTPIGLQQTSGFLVPQYGMGGAGMMQPGTGMMQSGTGMMQPGTGMMQSGTGMVQPGIGMMQPGIGMMQPGIGMMQPGIGMMQPGIGMIQPGIGMMQPGMVPNAQVYNPGMMYQGGGTARPVQRPPPTTETSSADSGFAFLGKSSKGSAFDFVQDEMRNSKK